MESVGKELGQKGVAVFLEWEGSGLSVPDFLWELRQQTKTMLQMGTAPHRFMITEVINLSPGVVNLILGDIYAMAHHLGEVTGDVDGEVGGVFASVALWDTQLNEGILIHRSGVQWLVAALPIMNALAARREEQAAMDLDRLAKQTEGITIHLDKAIEPGRHSLSQLLDMLSEQIDV